MTLSNIHATGRKLLERMIEPLKAELPITISPSLDGPGDPLRPRIAVEPTGYATIVRLIRDPHASEGISKVYDDIDMYALDSTAIRFRFDALISETTRLLRQDAKIAAAGEDVLRPSARWFTSYPFMLSAARHWDLSLDDMVKPADVSVPGGPTILREDDAIMTSLLVTERDGCIVHCSRTTYRRHLRCRHLTIMRSDDKRIIATYSDEDKPIVRFSGRLPETVLAALPGRNVAHVANDARMGPLRDLTITGANNTDAGVVLEVNQNRVKMRRGRTV